MVVSMAAGAGVPPSRSRRSRVPLDDFGVCRHVGEHALELRERVEHIDLDDADTFKTQLLNEKRRMFPYVSKFGSSDDPLHELNEEFSEQPTQPTDRLMSASMAAITKFNQ